MIEAVTEDLDLKNRLWRELDRPVAAAHEIFASNTSSLPIAAMASATAGPTASWDSTSSIRFP